MRTATLALLLAFAAAPAAADLLAVESQNGNLYRIDPTTAAKTLIGSTGVFFMGIEWNPVDCQLYGVSTGVTSTGAPALFRIDPETAVATNLGVLSNADRRFAYEGDFTFAPDGTAWAFGITFPPFTESYYMTFDVTSLAVTLVGPIPNVDLDGMTWRSDGALVGIDSAANRFVEVNTTTGVLTPIAPLGFDPGTVAGLTVHGGVGYLVTGEDGTNALYTIDLFTGQTTLVGGLGAFPSAFGLVGLASVPEPGMIVLLGVALLALRRRLR